MRLTWLVWRRPPEPGAVPFYSG